MTIALITDEALVLALQSALPLLAQSLRFVGGRFTIEDLQNEILSHTVQLWVVFDPHQVMDISGVLTTCFVKYPSKKVLQIQFLAGTEINDWMGMAEETLMRYAADGGATALEMSGRFGWIRPLENRGWKSLWVTLEKQVNGQRQQPARNGEDNNRTESSRLSPETV